MGSGQKENQWKKKGELTKFKILQATDFSPENCNEFRNIFKNVGHHFKRNVHPFNEHSGSAD